MEKKYTTLRDFYPYYLTEHQDKTCQILHFIGTSLFFFFLIFAFVSGDLRYLIACPLMGYGFAWVGHFFFEKNKPATFQYPLFSLISDFILYFHILTGQLPKKMKEAKSLVLGE
jgi:hypothetical protein